MWNLSFRWTRYKIKINCSTELWRSLLPLTPLYWSKKSTCNCFVLWQLMDNQLKKNWPTTHFIFLIWTLSIHVVNNIHTMWNIHTDVFLVHFSCWYKLLCLLFFYAHLDVLFDVLCVTLVTCSNTCKYSHIRIYNMMLNFTVCVYQLISSQSSSGILDTTFEPCTTYFSSWHYFWYTYIFRFQIIHVHTWKTRTE